MTGRHFLSMDFCRRVPCSLSSQGSQMTEFCEGIQPTVAPLRRPISTSTWSTNRLTSFNECSMPCTFASHRGSSLLDMKLQLLVSTPNDGSLSSTCNSTTTPFFTPITKAVQRTPCSKSPYKTQTWYTIFFFFEKGPWKYLVLLLLSKLVFAKQSSNSSFYGHFWRLYKSALVCLSHCSIPALSIDM